MQTSAPTTVQAPAPPSAPAAPASRGTPATAGGSESFVVHSSDVPMTAQEIRALRARRSEISTQLESASSRREDLANRLEKMPPATRAGVEARIAQLDRRILSLETELEATGRQLSSAPAGLVASTTAAQTLGGLSPESVTAIGGAFTLFVLAPIAVAAARLMWKRGNLARLPAAASAENSQRLDRIENAVEAIAIEVERVSEGQRFVTRLLAEGQQFPGVEAHARAPEAVPVRAESPQKR